MRVVLDESVPRQLAKHLREFGIAAFPFDHHWRGLKNGVLLRTIASEGFEILVTCDRNLLHQQSQVDLPVGVLSLPSNRRRIVLAASRAIADTLSTMFPRDQIEISLDGSRGGVRVAERGLIPLRLGPVPPFDGT